MDIDNIEHVDCASHQSYLIFAGAAYTEADSYAGPGGSLADALSYASGSGSSATSRTYTSARKTRFSEHAAGLADAQAYDSDGDISHSGSVSRYRSTSFFGNITASSSFSSSYP